MPGSGLSAPSDSPQLSPARRLRALPAEDTPPEPYVSALQDVVTIAMDVLDTSIHTLTSKPGACSEIISSVQAVGRNWDDHPDWPGRGWYVQLLLAVAGLSRVVEWWDAEKGFWNFEDENDQDAEPIRFIMGGHTVDAEGHEVRAFHRSGSPGATASISGSPIQSRMQPQTGDRSAVGGVRSNSSSPAIEPRDRRSVSEGEYTSKLGAPVVEEESTNGPLPPVQEAASPEPAPASSSESVNVLMELSLDEERFLYLSPAWKTVVG